MVQVTVEPSKWWSSGRKVVGLSPLAAGCRVATVGQLLFAPWAWAYSTLHPYGIGK